MKAYKDMNKKIGKEQYLVPYLMSSHPGSTLKEAIELAEYLRDLGYMLRSYLELSADMILTQLTKKRLIFIIHQIIKPDT